MRRCRQINSCSQSLSHLFVAIYLATTSTQLPLIRASGGQSTRETPSDHLVQTNGHLQHLGTSEAYRPWIASYGSYTQDWQVIADLHLGSVALTQNDSDVWIFLAVLNAGDTNIEHGHPGDHVDIGLVVDRDEDGLTVRRFDGNASADLAEISWSGGSLVSTTQIRKCLHHV